MRTARAYAGLPHSPVYAPMARLLSKKIACLRPRSNNFTLRVSGEPRPIAKSQTKREQTQKKSLSLLCLK